jgi:hypothetical protein
MNHLFQNLLSLVVIISLVRIIVGANNAICCMLRNRKKVIA